VSVPLAVKLAAGAVGIAVAVQAALALLLADTRQAGWAMWGFAGLLWTLILVGLLRRSRLAWLWGRYLTIILGAVLVVTTVSRYLEHAIGVELLAIYTLGLGAPLLAAGLALGRPSVYPFYGLVCPTCGASTGLGDDLLFRRARCRKCKAVW
jgi:hypothetical protein